MDEVSKNVYRQTAGVYDIVHRNKPPMPDVPFYLEYAKLLCGENGEKGEVLELGCGTGRVALALAKEGFYVTGLDLSQQMLDVFQNKLVKECPDLNRRIKLVYGNMADFSIGRKFALITAPFRAFQSVTTQKDIEGTLLCTRMHLTEDGLFIVNVFNPSKNPLDEDWCRPEVFIDEIIDEKTGIRVERYECRQRIDTANQIIYPYLAYNVTYPDGRTERQIEHLQLKYYYSPELRAEVEKAGMVIVEEFSWYDKQPPGLLGRAVSEASDKPGGREIILVCKRA